MCATFPRVLFNGMALRVTMGMCLARSVDSLEYANCFGLYLLPRVSRDDQSIYKFEALQIRDVRLSVELCRGH